jgi:hypothetical protein
VNPAYVSAIFGLVGASIGGLTSFLTTWLTQRAQLLEKRREAENIRRQDLFDAFIIEASRLYGDALSHEKDDVTDLVQLYALVGKIRLWASRPVVTAAEHAMEAIIRTYLEPNRTLHEIRVLAQQGGMNFLAEFGEAARAELGGSTGRPR